MDTFHMIGLLNYTIFIYFTVKPDVLFPWILQYCWEYWNFDCEIAQVATDVIKLQVEIHNHICKQSLWLATSSKQEPIKYSEQMDWFFFATSSQSETLFTNLVVNFNLQFDHVGCNLLRAILQSKLQYSQQYFNIQGNRFDCKSLSNSNTIVGKILSSIHSKSRHNNYAYILQNVLKWQVHWKKQPWRFDERYQSGRLAFTVV